MGRKIAAMRLSEFREVWEFRVRLVCRARPTCDHTGRPVCRAPTLSARRRADYVTDLRPNKPRSTSCKHRHCGRALVGTRCVDRRHLRAQLPSLRSFARHDLRETQLHWSDRVAHVTKPVRSRLIQPTRRTQEFFLGPVALCPSRTAS
jgi:hypothetical protein